MKKFLMSLLVIATISAISIAPAEAALSLKSFSSGIKKSTNNSISKSIPKSTKKSLFSVFKKSDDAKKNNYGKNKWSIEKNSSNYFLDEIMLNNMAYFPLSVRGHTYYNCSDLTNKDIKIYNADYNVIATIGTSQDINTKECTLNLTYNPNSIFIEPIIEDTNEFNDTTHYYNILLTTISNYEVIKIEAYVNKETNETNFRFTDLFTVQIRGSFKNTESTKIVLEP